MSDPIIISANTPAVIQIKTGPLSANLTSAVQEVNNQTGSVTINWANLPGAPVLANVATSGLYSDLSGTPNLTVYLTTSSAASTYQPLGNYANSTHTHAISDVTGLQAALDGKQASGSYVLTSDSRLSDARTPLAHNQAFSTITGTPTTLAGYGITDGYSTSNPSGYITASALTGYLTTSTAAATYTPQTRTIATGTGLSGGGDLSANRTLSLAASGVTAGTYGSDSQTPRITIDTYGRVTSASSGAIYIDWAVISSKPPITNSSGVALYSAAANLADYELIRAKLKDYSETRATPAISAGSLTLNLETGNFFAVSLNATVSTAIAITNPPATGSVGSFTLELTADGTARTINWGSIKWPGGTAPTLTSASGKRDIFVFYTSDGGANWYGLIGGQNL